MEGIKLSTGLFIVFVVFDDMERVLMPYIIFIRYDMIINRPQ